MSAAACRTPEVVEAMNQQASSYQLVATSMNAAPERSARVSGWFVIVSGGLARKHGSALTPRLPLPPSSEQHGG
jgi:hypothetical protein